MPQLRSLLFVSESLVAGEREDAELASILRRGRARNASLNVHATMVYTHVHFAEILEGQKQAIEELLFSIERDPRHRNMRVVDDIAVDRLSFPDLAMAYCGPSTFVQQRIEPLMTTPMSRSVRKLRLFMKMMTA